MNKLKCIGSKCPYYKEHEFRMSYFTCGLDGYSYKKDSYQERECKICDSLIQMYVETLIPEDMSEVIERMIKYLNGEWE